MELPVYKKWNLVPLYFFGEERTGVQEALKKGKPTAVISSSGHGSHSFPILVEIGFIDEDQFMYAAKGIDWERRFNSSMSSDGRLYITKQTGEKTSRDWELIYQRVNKGL